MERQYKDRLTPISNAKFFVGYEVEKTPAHGIKTLFVVGVQDLEESLLLASNNGAGHIYLGANMSFHPKDHEEFRQWEKLALKLIQHGYLVSLDFDYKYYEEYILESGLIEHNNFIPVISVKLPYIRQMPYNTVLKIDDIGFNKSNPGVWSHRLHDLQSGNTFTHWIDYRDDTTV